MATTSPAVATAPAPVREAIRSLLMASAEYQSLDPDTRRDIARGLVQISSSARALAEEQETRTAGPRPRPLARALNAGSEFSGVAADRVARTTHQILNAVSFPRFVNELITGVFKAMIDANQQQMQSFVDLIKNVAATTEGFADANVGVQGAREWLAERFPGSFVVEGEVDDFAPSDQPLTPEEAAERDASTRLRLRPGASMPSEGALKTALGMEPQDSLPGGDPENLVAVARSSLAKNRQQMLSTMVMMGMQRIVIESGRLNASMRFHIDTRSAAADDRGSSFDVRNETDADVGAKFGPWGVNAKMKNTIGYVSTQSTQTTEEMNTDLDLNSSVELIFKTDYLPLDRLAGGGTADRIRVNALNPEAEMKAATDERRARRQAQGDAEEQRRAQLGDRIKSAAAAGSKGASGSSGASGATGAPGKPADPTGGATGTPGKPTGATGGATGAPGKPTGATGGATGAPGKKTGATGGATGTPGKKTGATGGGTQTTGGATGGASGGAAGTPGAAKGSTGGGTGTTGGATDAAGGATFTIGTAGATGSATGAIGGLTLATATGASDERDATAASTTGATDTRG